VFSECFSAGDIEGLMALYEGDRVFPNHHGTFRGPEQIRPVLQGNLDSGAMIEFDRQTAFETGDLALVQNAWTLTNSGGEKVTGVSAEIAKKQSDGTWK